MKLLGWMHRKFRQNNGDVLRELGGGSTCNCLSGRPSLDGDRHSRSLRHRQYDAFKARSLHLDVGALDGVAGGGGRAGEPLAKDPLGGLLAIGTLGIESGPIEENEEEDEMAYPAEEKSFAAVPAEPVVTPAALEAIAEKEAEATTETDLMVVSVELEKVLTVEAEKVGGRMSSARSSQAGAAACPLQGFLFGSAIETAEAAETTAAAPPGGARRERRASLGELFVISKIAEEGGGEKAEDGKFAGGDGGHDGEAKITAEMCQMKKKLTKRRGGKGMDDDGSSNASTVETKLQKILQIFHRKVHPESNMSKKSSKTSKIEKKDYVPRVGGNDPAGTAGSIVFAVNGGCRKENPPSINFCSNPPSYSCGVDLNGSREHWIKTDAEYLVLEL